MSEYTHNMSVGGMDENEAKAIVLSLRALLSFEEKTNLSYKHLHDIAYLNDSATAAFLEVLNCE